MDRFSPHWLKIRIAYVLASAPGWILIRFSMPDDFSQPPDWSFPLVVSAFVLFGTVAMSTFDSRRDWVAPGWRHSFFNFQRPLEAMHLLAWSCISGTAALLLFGLRQLPIDWAWVLPGSIGVGMLAGIRLASIPGARGKD